MKAIILLALITSAMAVPAHRDTSKFFTEDIHFSEYLPASEIHKQSRIVGGEIATPTMFPFMAHLSMFVGEAMFTCDGTIIDSDWIMTAAHCVDSIIKPVNVMVGKYLQYEQEVSQVLTTSSGLFPHPGWNRTTRENDIAVISLANSLEFNEHIQPIRLPSRSQQSETYNEVNATVIGWGRYEDENLILSDKLRYVNVPVISNSNCQSIYPQLTIFDTQVCTSGIGGKGTCTGDSGGPLVYRESDGNSTQIGIVSYGYQTCTAGKPSVYTNVNRYLDWISNTTGISIRH